MLKSLPPTLRQNRFSFQCSSEAKFQKVIVQAEKACEQSGQAIADHFNLSVKMVSIGSGAQRGREDYYLSRYACYLIVQNADPHKPIVALGQTYFAVQTRRQEIADELALSGLPENQKRLIFRELMSAYNLRLAEAARLAGVMNPRDFAVFTDEGYIGLYASLRENDMHARKHLKPKEKILDHMGSEELADNIFRTAQGDAAIRRGSVSSKEQANATHYRIGQEVREAIRRMGGTMPENLPTPEKSIQQLQREEQLRLERERQPSLFDEPDDTAHQEE